MNLNRLYLNDDKAVLDFTFAQTKDDFIVDEIFDTNFTNSGNYLILHIKKKNISTWDLISYVAKVLNISQNEVGYAGLKDKNATTTQYISIPLNRSRDIEKINNKNIKILATFQHKYKIKIGTHKGNKFKIKLKDIDKTQLDIFYRRLSHIQKYGVPNYFGFQRFGNENNFKKSKDLVEGNLVINDKILSKFLKKAYQSYFFNGWLIKRVELSSKENLKRLLVLDGDISNKTNKKIITGLLPGRGAKRATKEALKIEQQFDDVFIQEKGMRRDAWIVPKDIKNKLINDDMVVEFSLPNSAYATVIIEALKNEQIQR
jgi:tRNA pseudouridine13 synthase